MHDGTIIGARAYGLMSQNHLNDWFLQGYEGVKRLSGAGLSHSQSIPRAESRVERRWPRTG